MFLYFFGILIKDEQGAFVNELNRCVMPDYKMPGVYIDELEKLPGVMEELPATVPAFIGYTEKAALKDENDLRDIPYLIKNLAGYELYFGYADSGRDPSAFEMYAHMQLFFGNGGAGCFICSIGDFVSTEGNVLVADLYRGLYAVCENTELNLLMFPDAHKLGNPADFYALHTRAIEKSAKLQDRFVIMDVYNDPANGGDWKKDIAALRASLLLPPDKLRYAAAYFPCVYTPHKAAAQLLSVVPAIAGVYAYSGSARGIWKSPANMSLQGVISPQYTITNAEQDVLTIDAEAGKSVNTIRKLNGKGNLVWGSRTLAGNDHEWRYISVSRLCIWISSTIKRNLGRFIFEPNDSATWGTVKNLVENYLLSLWKQGGLVGSQPQHAFYVHVGAGITMRQTDLLEGRMLIEIGVAPTRQSEFIIMKISQQMAIVPVETLFEAKQTKVFPTKKIPLDSRRTLLYGNSNLAKMAAVAHLGKGTGKKVVKVNLLALTPDPEGANNKIGYLIAKAGAKDWILLFDEADALFGKRSEIRDSHDKYANVDTNFLLESIDAYNGVLVLSAARKNNIDDAFLRRFNAVIKFI